jgi:signal peptide peptidase SppA
MQPIFRSPLFALLESYAPALLAGPEGRVQSSKPKLAAGQIGVFGVLGQSDWFVDTDYAQIRADVRRARNDPQAKTIDLIIDSPGGSCTGLPETADVIHEANRVKPVRALVTGVAASAAYWLASQASTIRVTQSGEVGSVGVLDIHADITKALDNAGVKVTAVSSTPEKTERAPFNSLSDEARAHMQRGVTAWYGDFLSAVRRGRGARVSQTGTYGNGRMLSAKEALSSGLIDFISGGSL